MQPDWTDDQPIYRQLRDKVVMAILDGTLGEGEALPSVRSVAVDMQVNPITVSKAYQELVADNLVEKRRGLGMFVIEGARTVLLAHEKDKFLQEEWPRIVSTIERLGLDVAQLLKNAPSQGGH